MPTLLNILKNKSNDYSFLERKYTSKKGVGFFKQSKKEKLSKSNTKDSYSVIIPSYKFPKYLNGLLNSLDNQSYKGRLEVIIVNHIKTVEESRRYLIKPKKYVLKIIGTKEKYSRAIARNIGLAYAKGSIVSFIDSDMILPNNFVIENSNRIKLLDRIVLTGLYENIKPGEYKKLIERLKKKNFSFNGNCRKDFRSKKIFTLKDMQHGYNISKEETGKIYRIMKKTRNFKDFGFYRKYGIWHLPWMTLTIALTLKRKYAIEVGGFNSNFKGWGFEDTYFGAKLIADDIYIIPLLNCVPFRVKHLVRNGSLKEKYLEAVQNSNRFENLIREEFDRENLEDKFKKTYSTKRLEKTGIVIFKN